MTFLIMNNCFLIRFNFDCNSRNSVWTTVLCDWIQTVWLFNVVLFVLSTKQKTSPNILWMTSPKIISRFFKRPIPTYFLIVWSGSFHPSSKRLQKNMTMTSSIDNANSNNTTKKSNDVEDFEVNENVHFNGSQILVCHQLDVFLPISLRVNGLFHSHCCFSFFGGWERQLLCRFFWYFNFNVNK